MEYLLSLKPLFPTLCPHFTIWHDRPTTLPWFSHKKDVLAISASPIVAMTGLPRVAAHKRIYLNAVITIISILCSTMPLKKPEALPH
jgi:hypothetical protein